MSAPSFYSEIRKKKEQGLTLVEMVVVSLLLAIMGSVLYSSLNGIGQAKEAIQANRQSTRTARFVLGRISRELRGALAEPLYIQEDTEDSQPRKRNPFLVGENSKKGTIPGSDSLEFVSSSAAQATYSPMANHGHVQIKYRLVANPDVKPGEAEFQQHLLIREETPAGVKDQKTIDKRKVIFPIANNISSINFRYYSNGEWKTQWTNTESGLPEAVEIALITTSSNGTADTYKTAVSVAPKRGKSPRKSQTYRTFATQ